MNYVCNKDKAFLKLDQIQNQNRVVIYVAVCIILYTVFVNNLNKNAFQLKAHILLADTKSNTYNLTLE